MWMISARAESDRSFIANIITNNTLAKHLRQKTKKTTKTNIYEKCGRSVGDMSKVLLSQYVGEISYL
jgi:hypothetical protein